MAPLSSEPRQILVILNQARRSALYQVSCQIAGYMRSQLELKQDEDDEDDAAPAKEQLPPRPTYGSDQDKSVAPLFATPKDRDRPSEWDENPRRRAAPPNPQLVRLRAAALTHFDAWRRELLTKLKEITAAMDDTKIREERLKRQEKIAKQRTESPGEGENLISFGEEPESSFTEESLKAIRALQQLYHPIPTRLMSISVEDREEVLSCVLLLLLSTGHYSAYSRTFAVYLTSALDLPLSVLTREETEISKSLVEASSTATEQAKSASTMSADAEAQRRKQENQGSRYWKVGLASLAGAAVIGVTGGLAAPVVAGAIGGLMGTVGLGGVASFLGIFWMNGALVGTLFGAFGARMTGEMMDQYAKEVEDFRFLPLKEEWGKDCARNEADDRRLRVTIGVNGWLTSKEDVTKPWRTLGDESETFALRYELDSLLALGQTLETMVSTYAWSLIKSEILRRTVLATLWSALWPAYLLKVASSIDNPFSLARNRSDKAGKILADALINKVQGERPVTLVGYSLGARVIYSCLRSLAERKAFGLVETVVLIGAPVPSNKAHWQVMRSVVSGKLFNVGSENDYILAFLYRATSVQLGVAGLQEIRGIEGVENLNLSEEVKGHLRYPELVGRILARCGFPNVRGGDEPIEKEAEPITLHEADGSGRMGTLIELDGLSVDDAAKVQRPANGPSSTPESLSAYGHRDSATVPHGAQAGSVSVSQGLLETRKAAFGSPNESGYKFSMEVKQSSPTVPSSSEHPSSSDKPSSETTSGGAARSSSTNVTPVATEPWSPPRNDGSHQEHTDNGDNYGCSDDEEDEEHTGIQMMDNDEGELGEMSTYLEPLRIDD